MKNFKKVKSGVVVWVDVDEVLVEFRSMLNDHLNKSFNLNLDRDYVAHDWHYSDVLPKEASFPTIMSGLPKNWPEHQPLYAGAAEFTQTLKEMGCEVVLITHIDLELAPYRLKNLFYHGIYFDEIYFTLGKSKTDFAVPLSLRFTDEENRPAKNIIIDDKAQNVIEFLDMVPNMSLAVTMDYNYNKESLAKCRNYGKMLDAKSKTQQEMYKKVLAEVKRLQKKN